MQDQEQSAVIAGSSVTTNYEVQTICLIISDRLRAATPLILVAITVRRGWIAIALALRLLYLEKSN
jgi:hypothetical protein